MSNLLVPEHIDYTPRLAPSVRGAERLAVLPGGKDGDTDWLSPMPEGQEFLCKLRHPVMPPGRELPPNYILHQGTVLKHIGAARFVEIGKEQHPVDPKEFCRAFEFYAVLNDEPIDDVT